MLAWIQFSDLVHSDLREEKNKIQSLLSKGLLHNTYYDQAWDTMYFIERWETLMLKYLWLIPYQHTFQQVILCFWPPDEEYFLWLILALLPASRLQDRHIQPCTTLIT